jgi:calcineurin-like phosphoesterase family protein
MTEDFKRVMFVGDIHGYNRIWNKVKELVAHFEVDAFVVLGDFGWWNDQHPAAREFVNDTGKSCYWIDGNHENFYHLYANFNYDELLPQEVNPDIFWLPRGTVMPLGRYQCMFFGGGTSVDKHRRVDRESWWAQEKISQEEIDRALHNWTLHPPSDRTMLITHEVPSILYEATPELVNETKVKNPDSAHDRMLLDQLLMNIQPDLHFHGHWHIYHNTRWTYPNFSSDPAMLYRNRTVQSVGLDCEPPQNFWVQNVGREL